MVNEVAVVNGGQALELLERGRLAIEQAKTCHELKDIRDKAEAVRQYVKQQGESLLIQNHCAEIKLRAERKAGELLAEMKIAGQRDRGQGGDRKSRFHDGTVNYTPPPNSNKTRAAKPLLVEPPPSLEDLGVDKKESHRWQKEAEVSERDFENYVKECNESKEEVTQSGLLRLTQKSKPKKKVSAVESLKRAYLKLSSRERKAFVEWIQQQKE